MSYCISCGVEVDSNIKECPLCLSQIHQTDEIEKILEENKYPEIEEEEAEGAPKEISSRRRRLVTWEAISVSAVVPMLIVLAINMIVEKEFIVTWAKYPLTSLGLTWLLATIPIFLMKKPLLIVAGETLSLIAFLVLMDFYDNWSIDWFYQIAMPIIGIIIIVTSVVVTISVKVKNKGVNIAAFVLLGISVICLGLNLAIVIYQANPITLSIMWSLYAIIPLVIIAGFLLYLHYRLTRVVDLKRVLEIKKRLQT